MPTRVLVHFVLASITTLFIAGFLFASPSNSTATLAPASSAEVAIPSTRRLEFISKINNHGYVINVALPFEAVPPNGYPVLYVLDGYWYFPGAAGAARGVAPQTIVVGIGYPDDLVYSQSVLAKRGPVPAFLAHLPAAQSAPFLERVYDLTLPASDGALATQTLAGLPKQRSENVGGIDDFLRIIETEVKPRVAALAPIDMANQALFGHSFGGLAVLHALFVEPNAFRTFIIASPSVWWNNKAVLADEGRFAATISSGQASPRVLVTVGGMEGSSEKYPPGWGIDPVAAEAFTLKNRMVENGGELVARLKALHGRPGYQVADYVVFDKENHSIAAWSAMVRGISFAFDHAN